MGASGGVMVSKLDLQAFTSEFESHCVTHLNKKPSKLQLRTSCADAECTYKMTSKNSLEKKKKKRVGCLYNYAHELYLMAFFFFLVQS